jgi:hypothetical protein
MLLGIRVQQHAGIAVRRANSVNCFSLCKPFKGSVITVTPALEGGSHTACTARRRWLTLDAGAGAIAEGDEHR